MNEYGRRPIPRPLPRFGGDTHSDEPEDAAQSETVKRIADIHREHTYTELWYDEQICTTQYLCGCRTWVYDHHTHVAKEIAKELEQPSDSTPLCPASCDCSCCYGYTDKSCHCYADTCNCGRNHH